MRSLTVFGTASLTVLCCMQIAFGQIPNELGTSDKNSAPALPGVIQEVRALPVSNRYRDPVANNVALAIDSARRRVLKTDVHSPWQIMHAIVGLRQHFRIEHDGKLVNGIDWVSSGPKYDGEDWFQVTEWGARAHPYSKPYAFEGHANQSLAILSMCGLPRTHKLKAGNTTITIDDMINHAKKELSEKEEVTWSLWSLSRYLHPNASWKNKDGEVWDFERMVELQLKKPLKGSPCGGTHAMFALAHARNMRLQYRLPLRGIWMEAEMKIQKCIALARSQQNQDGTFSTKFFEDRATEEDFDKRIASTGHILEFLMIALPQQRMNESWVRRGVDATARDINSNRGEYVKCAPLYHAVNGLTIYLDRTQPVQRRVRMATRPASSERVVSEGDGKLTPANRAPTLVPAPATQEKTALGAKQK